MLKAAKVASLLNCHSRTILKKSALGCCGACGISSTNTSLSSAPSLQKLVREEVKLEKLDQEPLPKFTNFKTVLNGSQATLERINQKNSKEKVIVKLDVNEAVEVEKEMEEEYDTDDDSSPDQLFLPVFTVSVSKPSGETLLLQCSFDGLAEYHNMEDEWDNFNIDSISVLSKGESPDTVYKIDPNFLSRNFQEGLLAYIEEKGIDKTFISEIVSFYRELEHSSYLDGFLTKLDKFLTD